MRTREQVLRNMRRLITDVRADGGNPDHVVVNPVVKECLNLPAKVGDVKIETSQECEMHEIYLMEKGVIKYENGNS